MFSFLARVLPVYLSEGMSRLLLSLTLPFTKLPRKTSFPALVTNVACKFAHNSVRNILVSSQRASVISSVGLKSIAAVRLFPHARNHMRSSQSSPAMTHARRTLFFPTYSTAFTVSCLLRLLLHSPPKACCARIGLRRLGGRGRVGHLGHGQLAHGVFRVLRVAAGEEDVLNMAHFDEEEPWGGGHARARTTLWGLVWCEVVMRRGLLVLGPRSSLEEALRAVGTF